MNSKVGERIFGFLILLLVLFFLFTASRLNSVAGRMPMLVGTFTLIMVLAYFAGEFRPRKEQAQEAFRQELAEDDEVTAPDKAEIPWYDVKVWGWLIVLFACVYIAGIVFGISILTVLFYRFAAKRSWRGGILFGALQGAFLYIVFEVVFRSALYPGLIAEFISSLTGG